MKKILRRAATTNASFCHLIPAGLSFDSWKVVKNYYLGVSVMSHEVRDRANQINVFISKSRKEVNLSTQDGPRFIALQELDGFCVKGKR